MKKVSSYFPFFKQLHAYRTAYLSAGIFLTCPAQKIGQNN